MLFQQILVLSLATLCLSFTVPKGAANGFYEAHYTDAGEEVHELIEANPLQHETESGLPVLGNATRSRRRGRQIIPRNVETWCGCGLPMNTGDTNSANWGLQSQLASKSQIFAGQAYYVVHNTAIAFFTWDVYSGDYNSNQNGKVYKFDGSNIVFAYNWQISEACGSFIPGTARTDGGWPVDYGYMNYHGNLGVSLSHPEESISHHC